MIFISLVISLDMMLMVLISVAFLTLLERKILGYIQLRKGPNKVGFMGLLQPFSDAIKLFSKEMIFIYKSNYLFFIISPIMSMMLMLLLWHFIPLMSKIMNFNYSIMMILCLMSLGVYFMMLAGWSSNSVYSLIGSLRSVAQTISYEVSLIMIMLSVIILSEYFNMIMLFEYQINLWFIYLMFPMSMIFFISCLAELNRTPFDFAEGESELVSGFNTEYMSGSFAMIFIAEYGMIMFMMMLMNMFFMGGNLFSLSFYFMYLILIYLIIWIRGSYPRFRYDNLMYLTWKSFLPISMNYLIFLIGFKFLFNSLII